MASTRRKEWESWPAAFHGHTMMAMTSSTRMVVTVFAALVVIGGLLRLTTDKRPAEVSLPEASESDASRAP